MFVRVRNVLQFRAPLRSSSHQAAVKSSQAAPVGKWDVMAAVCVGNNGGYNYTVMNTTVTERPPYITPALSDIEQRTVDLLKRKEFEESMLNDHELRHK